MAFSGSLLCAAPQGGQVRAGQAQITQQGKVTNINQSSQKAAINWQKFNIAADETVNFKQPNAHSVTLNRVIGNEKSVINGAMNANGKVFLLNPHGTLIGKGAKINVGGLVASTANISDDDFMQGKYRFTGNGSGVVENYGEIAVPAGGVVALIAPIVKNNGNIKADSASVLLASAEHFSITLPENGDFAYTIDKGTLQGLVDNGGAVLADGGLVVLTAAGLDSVKKSVVRHTGIIQANTVANKNGKILLLGDLDNSRTEVSGSLKAEAPISGDGGFIETSANQVQIDDSAFISTKAANGKTGEWLIDPADYTVAATGGDITGQAVSNALQNNNLTLKSTNGKASGKGDVIINDTINWNKNTLILNAQNDIHINKTINGSGSAKLALQYGQASADGGESNYYLDKDVRVNLPAGQNFSTQKGSAGEKVDFEVIHEMPEIVKNGSGKYESKFTQSNIAFGKDIDLGYTKNYQGFAGYYFADEFIDREVEFRLSGLGHHLSNLYIVSPSGGGNGVGFIREIPTDWVGTEIDNIHLQNVYINLNSSYAFGTGGLIGVIDSWKGNQVHKIRGSSVSGNISGQRTGGLVGVINDNAYTYIDDSYALGDISGGTAGGLLGSAKNTYVNNSYFSGSVAGLGDYSALIGGLVGELENNSIVNNSYSTGAVSGWRSIGGLVGGMDRSYISDSYSSSNVSGEDEIGGLVGEATKSSITNSHTVGVVSGVYNTGGLVGSVLDESKIIKSYATGQVTGKESTHSIARHTGGLVGSLSNSEIVQSYSTGDVSGIDTVGGLVGDAFGKISHSYSSSNVSGERVVGGLTGYVDGEISKSYSTGSVVASTQTGGLAGNAVHSIIEESYSSSNVSGQTTVGGLIGLIHGDVIIKNSYATGTLKETLNGTYGNSFDQNNQKELYFGGLVGEISSSYDDEKGSTVKNSYFSGDIDASDTIYKGAIVGGLSNYGKQYQESTIENVYYDKDKVATGGQINGQTVGTGLTTAQMQDKNSFKGFDFDNVWTIKDGETPTLLAFNGSGTPTGGDNTGGDNTGSDNTGGDNTGGDNTGGDNQQQGDDNQQQGGDNQQQGGDNQQQGGDNQQQDGDNQQQGGDNTGDNNNQDGDNQQQDGDNQQQGGDKTCKNGENCITEDKENIPPKDALDIYKEKKEQIEEQALQDERRRVWDKFKDHPYFYGMSPIKVSDILDGAVYFAQQEGVNVDDLILSMVTAKINLKDAKQIVSLYTADLNTGLEFFGAGGRTYDLKDIIETQAIYKELESRLPGGEHFEKIKKYENLLSKEEIERFNRWGASTQAVYDAAYRKKYFAEILNDRVKRDLHTAGEVVKSGVNVATSTASAFLPDEVLAYGSLFAITGQEFATLTDNAKIIFGECNDLTVAIVHGDSYEIAAAAGQLSVTLADKIAASETVNAKPLSHINDLKDALKSIDTWLAMNENMKLIDQLDSSLFSEAEKEDLKTLYKLQRDLALADVMANVVKVGAGFFGDAGDKVAAVTTALQETKNVIATLTFYQQTDLIQEHERREDYLINAYVSESNRQAGEMVTIFERLGQQQRRINK